MFPSKLSIIIPAYNEAATIRQILDKVRMTELEGGLQKEILVVNDCSRDETAQIVEDYIASDADAGIRLISQDKNRGKGAAIHKGIEMCTGDLILIQDADLEYDPAEYNLLLRPFLSNQADVVYGSRFIGGRPHRILFFWHSIGNRFLTFLSNAFTNLNLTDMETCYKMFRASVIRQIYFREQRFGFEPEVTAKVSRFPGIRIFEVGVSYYGRTYKEGKKITAKDGFRAVYCILKYNIWRRRYLK